MVSLAVVRSLAGFLSGVALGTACLTLVFLGMRAVMDVGGACADGGPYVSAQPCPEGSAIALFGGVLGLFAAGGLMAWFGSRFGGRWLSLIALGWPALFLSLGWNFFEYGLDPAGPATGPEWGFLIPGVLFWAMGGGPLLLGLIGMRGLAGATRSASLPTFRRSPASEPLRIEFAPGAWGAPRPAPARGSQPPPSPGTAGATPIAADPSDVVDEALVSQLERLAALHRRGALSEDEFAAAKARLLSDESLEA